MNAICKPMALCASFSSLMLLLTLLGSENARADEWLDRLFGMGPPDTFTLASETLGRDLHVYVRVPQSYEASDEVWPVIYLLDGGILFPMLVPYHFMLTIDEIAPEAIVVGISYGGLGFANGNLRSTDYTAPSPEVAYFGGASAFQDFLADEVLPRLRREFRIDPERTVLFGQSLGGQFAIHAALTRPELFS